MPLIRFDMLKGRSEKEIKKILDVSHKVAVDVFHIPQGDRYQIVNQHHAYEMIMEDTGLGFERSENRLLITVTTRQRTTEQKKDFYDKLVLALKQECEIEPEDIMFSMIINDDEDWSFGFGRAQFLTGEL